MLYDGPQAFPFVALMCARPKLLVGSEPSLGPAQVVLKFSLIYWLHEVSPRTFVSSLAQLVCRSGLHNFADGAFHKLLYVRSPEIL